MAMMGPTDLDLLESKVMANVSVTEAFRVMELSLATVTQQRMKKKNIWAGREPGCEIGERKGTKQYKGDHVDVNTFETESWKLCICHIWSFYQRIRYLKSTSNNLIEYNNWFEEPRALLGSNRRWINPISSADSAREGLLTVWFKIVSPRPRSRTGI
ncbi:hypothetical protein H106_05261 [Trichophyton rubrum CBS 735.88]|nr:hypothetical protein H106_05261 [Trichophyton rubrum CBS 735.88]